MALPFLTMLKKMGEFRRNQKLSRAEFEAMKLVKFRRLVRYAQQKSPYYADIIRDAGIHLDTCVPADFPVLTKAMLMANFDRIVTDRRITKAGVAEFFTRSLDPNELLFGDYHVLHTSGSSGEVGYFLFSDPEWVQALAPRVGQRTNMPRPKRKRLGRFRIAYYAAVGGHFAGVAMMASAERGLGRLFTRVNYFEINSPLPQVIEQLNAFQPELITGYTTGLKILAQKQNEGSLRIAPILVHSGGEAMTPADKAMLEAAFKCQAFNGYGSTEHLIQGGPGPDGETMTLYDDDLIYELFDDHSLVTNLFNYTQPLIRYHMSDVLRPIEQANPSSPNLVIKSLLGRAEKIPMFFNRDGVEDFIHPLSVVELFFAGVTRFQMRVIDKRSFHFLVTLDPSLTAAQRTETLAAVKRRLREFLDQKLMQTVAFEVIAVDDIPVDPKSRKFRLIVEEPARATALA